MTLRKHPIPSSAPRASSLLLLSALATAAMLLAAACGGSAGETPTATSDGPDAVSDDPGSGGIAAQDAVITVHSSPT